MFPAPCKSSLSTFHIAISSLLTDLVAFSSFSYSKIDQRIMEDYSDVESDEEPQVEDLEDRETLKRTKQPLGLSRNYVPEWTAHDAFREFFQNW